MTTHPGLACSMAKNKRGRSVYDWEKSPNKCLNALCFLSKAFLYEISYPHFSITLA